MAGHEPARPARGRRGGGPRDTQAGARSTEPRGGGDADARGGQALIHAVEAVPLADGDGVVDSEPVALAVGDCEALCERVTAAVEESVAHDEVDDDEDGERDSRAEGDALPLTDMVADDNAEAETLGDARADWLADPDALAVAIRTTAGTVLHTGDFKMDQLPLDGRPRRGRRR